MRGFALYLVILLLGSVALGSIETDPTERQIEDLSRRAIVLSLIAEDLYGFPMYLVPRVQVVPDLGQYWAWTDCKRRSIEIERQVIRDDYKFVYEDLMPHEVAHHVSCWLRNGDPGADHDQEWARISASLGGPDYNRRKR